MFCLLRTRCHTCPANIALRTGRPGPAPTLGLPPGPLLEEPHELRAGGAQLCLQPRQLTQLTTVVAEALNHALLGVKHGRDWEDGRAKETAVKLFDAMGKSPADAQLVSKARRRLSNLLFA